MVRPGRGELWSLAASATQAECVESVTGQSKLPESRGFFQCGVQRALGACRHHEVCDYAAFHADQVVVVTDEVLVQLVARVVVATGNPADHSRLFEVGQIAVDRTLRQFGAQLEELWNAGRMPDGKQRIDQVTSAACIDEVFRAESPSDFGMNSFV